MEVHTVKFQPNGPVTGFYKQCAGLFEGSIWYFKDEQNAVHIAGSTVHQPFEQLCFVDFNCKSGLWVKLDVSKMLLL